MRTPLWHAALVKDFAVQSTALKSLKKSVAGELQKATEAYLAYACDETKSAVLRVLDEHGIPSSLLQLQKFRIAHLRCTAGQARNQLEAELQEEAAEEKRKWEIARSVLREKFTLRSFSHVDMQKGEVGIGSDYIFRYSVKNDRVDWQLIDCKTGCAVDIFSGDPPERLGEVLHELDEQRMAWERAQIPDPRKASEDDQHSIWLDPDPGIATESSSDDDPERGVV